MKPPSHGLHIFWAIPYTTWLILPFLEHHNSEAQLLSALLQHVPLHLGEVWHSRPTDSLASQACAWTY